jgi:uncharacterized membrane protein
MGLSRIALFLGLFIVYQLYRIAADPSIGLALLTIFDALIVWLVWREYRLRYPPSPALTKDADVA